MAQAGRYIAVVDDDPSVLKALKRSLRARGFDARTYGSAQEFLASLSQELPECLLVDLRMPEMTGLELHHHLRRSGIQIPTILITAHSEFRVQERSESSGLIAVLHKPLEKASLLAAIDAAIGSGSRHGSP